MPNWYAVDSQNAGSNTGWNFASSASLYPPYISTTVIYSHSILAYAPIPSNLNSIKLDTLEYFITTDDVDNPVDTIKPDHFITTAVSNYNYVQLQSSYNAVIVIKPDHFIGQS